jgi:ABC-2 type transport system permease protein
VTSAELRVVERRGTIALAGREVRRVLTIWTQTLVPPVLTALLFLTVFGGALGSRIRGVEGIDYLAFILPGLVVMAVAGQSFHNNATSLYQAKADGYIEDVLTSPLRPWQVALGYITGGLLRSLVAAAAITLIALPFVGAIERPWLAAAAVVLTAFAFAPLGVIAAIWAESFDQHAFFFNLVIAPLALVAGIFYSADTLAEPWATLTRIDPLYYLVDATRAGYTGFHETSVIASLLVAAAVAASLFTLATALVARGWRLKP